MNPNEWILSMDTGISSKTIWAVMMGAVTEKTECSGMMYDVPHDPADFGRCYRLLQCFPEWEARMHLVGELLPKWKPMVREWATMKALYEEELPSGRCPKLYALMEDLEDEGRELDGWVRTSPNSWVKKAVA